MQLRLNEETIRRNRTFLHSVDCWIDEEAYRGSRSNYGCPPAIFNLLNLPIDEQPTYTDLIVDAGMRMKKPVTYLEIGVSVGKNFFVIANALHRARLFGFDWEAMSPVLSSRFEEVHRNGRTSSYRFNSNAVTYVQGNVFERSDWALLSGTHFNLIFSDAVHRPDAVLHEFEMMSTLGLIDEEEFFMIWDDLDDRSDGPLTGAFREIAAEMQRRYGLSDSQIYVTQANGWLGQHEHRHNIGVITNLDLD